jgi:hypothetical protein
VKPVSSILVVVDRSLSAADAVAKAVLLARAATARVELFMCDAERGYALSQAFVSTGVEQSRQACLADSHRHLETLRRLVTTDDVPITIDAACESPLYESIVRKVMRVRPDLVIKNVSGPLNRFDVTDWQLMRACPATLMLTRGRPWHLGALTHRPGVTAQVGTLTSKLIEALECDFLLVKPATYHCPVGEIYDRPGTSVRMGA